MPDVDLERAERLAAEFWTEPGDQQTARTLLVALVARVRALTAAGDALADCLDRSPWLPDPDEDQAAITAWRVVTATHSAQPNPSRTPPPR